MSYTFEILGISPVSCQSKRQQEIIQERQRGVEYLEIPKCTLDVLLESAESLDWRNWDLEQVVDAMIDFWVNNTDTIRYWKAYLKDAGSESCLVARVADFKSLRAEFESLLVKTS